MEAAGDKETKRLPPLVNLQRGQPSLQTQHLFNVCVHFELSSLSLYSSQENIINLSNTQMKRPHCQMTDGAHVWKHTESIRYEVI